MSYYAYPTLDARIEDGVMWVTFAHPPVNALDRSMLADLDDVAELLESVVDARGVVFQSAHPDVFLSEADPEIGGWRRTLERIGRLHQATIAKIDGLVEGRGHDLVLACDMRLAARERAKLVRAEITDGDPLVSTARRTGLLGTHGANGSAAVARSLDVRFDERRLEPIDRFGRAIGA